MGGSDRPEADAETDSDTPRRRRKIERKFRLVSFFVFSVSVRFKHGFERVLRVVIVGS